MSESADKRSNFARRLKQARLSRGLTQAQLGFLAGMEPDVASPRINQYERGVHEPRSATVQKLADALGIPPAFLYTDDDLLAKLLLHWGSLTKQQKRELVKLVETAPGK